MRLIVIHIKAWKYCFGEVFSKRKTSLSSNSIVILLSTGYHLQLRMEGSPSMPGLLPHQYTLLWVKSNQNWSTNHALNQLVNNSQHLNLNEYSPVTMHAQVCSLHLLQLLPLTEPEEVEGPCISQRKTYENYLLCPIYFLGCSTMDLYAYLVTQVYFMSCEEQPIQSQWLSTKFSKGGDT